MGIGTFGSFTQARLAIYAAQAGITVSGNNVANVNTTGYTRQKLDQSSLYIGGTDRYYSANNLRIGGGVLCDSVSQIRDPYLDIRYRNENAAVGAKDGWLAGLEGIQQILDEVGDGEIAEGEDFGIVGAYLEKFYDALNGLTDFTGLDQYDSQVRSAAENMAHTLNSYASRLETLYKETTDNFVRDVNTVNNLLTDIRGLNENIRTAEIFGDNSLELRDERNRKLDELSGYMRISVTYTTEHIGAGQEIEKMILKLGNANPDIKVDTDETTLIDGVYGCQISILPKMNDDPATKDNQPYLDLVGNPTADIGKAAYTDNLDLSISELRNSRGQLLYYTEKGDRLPIANNATTPAPDNKPIVGADGKIAVPNYTSPPDPTTGAVTITTYTRTGTAPNYTYYAQSYTRTPSREVRLDDNDVSGKLQSYRELLTEAGEFTPKSVIANIDENAATKRGIPYYQNVLDLFANKLATSYNNANQGYLTDEKGNLIRKNGNFDTDGRPLGEPLLIGGVGLNTSMLKADADPNSPSIPVWDMDLVPAAVKAAANATTSDQLNAYLQDPANNTGAQFRGGPLFSNNGSTDDTDPPITASNISISASWAAGAMVVPSFVCPTGYGEPASTDSDNIINRLTSLTYAKLAYQPNTLLDDAPSDVMFNGTFRDMWVNIGTVLGDDMSITGTQLDTHYDTALQIDTSRDSVSGVDFNDEAMNLMMYSKAYNAACRLMTTLDTVLDKLINGTGVTT